VNSRSKNYFQFAPVVEVVSVQRIVIQWYIKDIVSKEVNRLKGSCLNIEDPTIPVCWIGGNIFAYGRDAKNWQILAQNDGFPSVEAFFNWFSEDFTGQIVHWTERKY